MRTQLNEVQRLQKIAGLLKENDQSTYENNGLNEEQSSMPELSPEEQDVFNALTENLSEGLFDKNKFMSYVKKGAITAAVIGALFLSTKYDHNQKKAMVNTVQKAQLDSTIQNVALGGTAISLYDQYKTKIDVAAEKDIRLKGLVKEINRMKDDNEIGNTQSLEMLGRNYKDQCESILNGAGKIY